MMKKKQKKYTRALVVFLFSVFILFPLTEITYAQNLQLLSPNGGERWMVGKNKSIQWTSSGLPTNHAIQLELLHNGSLIGIIQKNISIGAPGETSSWTWKVGTYQGGTATPDSGYTIRIIDLWNRQYTDVSNGAFTLVRGIGSAPPANRPGPNLTPKPNVPNTIFELPDLVITDAWIDNSDIRWLKWKVENKNWRKVKLDPDNPFTIQYCAIGIRCNALRVGDTHIQELNRRGSCIVKLGWDYNCDVRLIVDFGQDVEEYNESNNNTTFRLSE
jgi:hypothetical protein